MTEQLQQQISTLSHTDPDKSTAPAPLQLPTEVPDSPC